jgi:hypothetical protein
MTDYNDIVNPQWDLLMAGIVLVLYIWGKVWVYHKFYKDDNKESKRNGKG